ncbi:hypothetical protein WR25_09804 [Diploscapter pachys]|uniref:Uncharacterized protein n=1 Tax=Diploscapter pachys TaxID=2018661 RepID=A0A2A2KGI7_9BILA|nr:hypothetical protein WR25_09804 [Diploscapter pachys]
MVLSRQYSSSDICSSHIGRTIISMRRFATIPYVPLHLNQFDLHQYIDENEPECESNVSAPLAEHDLRVSCILVRQHLRLLLQGAHEQGQLVFLR